MKTEPQAWGIPCRGEMLCSGCGLWRRCPGRVVEIVDGGQLRALLLCGVCAKAAA